MRRALLLVDVITGFDHANGDALLASFRARQRALVAALDLARAQGVPVVYANDGWGAWDGDAPKLVREAIAGRGGAHVADVAPRAGEAFVLKPRYSAFDHTPLVLLLRDLDIELLLLAGAATEMCVVQTAIDARELGFKVTVLADACACVDERLEALGLEYLEAVAGCRVARVSEVL
jgi:nicotinamidase-related amidase